MIDLKPCPFCGGKAEFVVQRNRRTKVICTNSECYLFYNSPTSWNNGDTDEHAKQRISTWWNRRTPEIVKVETNIYDQEETFPDCTVQVLTNTATGETSVGWWQNGK